MAFDRVVLQAKSSQDNRIYFTAHPFYGIDGDTMMYSREHKEGTEMPLWKERMANELWITIPGLRSIYFGNGTIVIQHTNVFSDEEITEAVINIVRPVLEQNLIIQNIEEATQ
jgi:hypothetical protein